jgi:hypothetical protein
MIASFVAIMPTRPAQHHRIGRKVNWNIGAAGISTAHDACWPEQIGLLFYPRMLYFAQRRSGLMPVLRAEE